MHMRHLLSALAVCVPLSGMCETFNAVSSVWSPYIMGTTGKVSGIGYEIFVEILRRTGDVATIKILPNKRALEVFKKGDADLIILDSPLWADPQRVKTYAFSDAFMSTEEYIYFQKDHYIDVKSPADLRNKTVDVMRGYYYPAFETAFQTNQVKKYEVDSEEILLKKLFTKRTDAVFMVSEAFQYTLNGLGYDPSAFKRGIKLSTTPLSLKIRIEKSNALPRINAAIAAMKKDGTMQRIIQSYATVTVTHAPPSADDGQPTCQRSCTSIH